jgi:TolA-binding protein
VEKLGLALEAPNLQENTRIYGRDMKENALNGQAFANKQLKRPEDEITVLERLVYNPEFNTPVSAEGAVRLMSLYALKHDPADPKTVEFADKAVALLKALQLKTHLVENFIALNSIAIKLGDELLDVHAYLKALDAYWAVRPRDVVAQMQKTRIKAIEQRIEQMLAGAKDKPMETAQAKRVIEEAIKPRLEESKKILAEFEKLPDFMPSLYFRLARCQADLNKKWEAIVVFNQILEDYPNSPVRELVKFSRLALYVDLGVAERSYGYCDDYMKEYPTGPHAAEVVYLRGIAAMRKKDWYMGEQYFADAVKQLSDLPERTEIAARASSDPEIKGNASKLREDAENHKRLYWTQCRYQIGNARFLQNKFDVAQQDFTAFCNEYSHVAGGKGEFMEDAEYQLALCHLFQGHYQKDPAKAGDDDGAIERLQNYLVKWSSQSSYGSDAKYRLAVCRYAAYESELCVKECEEWLAKYGNNKDEIPATRGVCAARRRESRAQAARRGRRRLHRELQARDHRRSVELLALRGRQAVAKGRRLGGDRQALHRIREDPAGAPGRGDVHLLDGQGQGETRQPRRSQKITIEALQKHIGNPKTEGVEMMLSQLAEWSRRRPPTRALVTDDKPLPKWDPEARTRKHAQAARGKPQPHRPSPARIRERRALPHRPHPAETRGDHRRHRGQVPTRATQPAFAHGNRRLLFRQRRDRESGNRLPQTEGGFPEIRPRGRRLGGPRRGETTPARISKKRWNSTATPSIASGAPWKLKEALIGQAKCWLEFADAEKDKDKKKADELWVKAKKQFEEVASVREWRGESTALALYYIAEIQFRQGDFPKATAAFERVTDSQGKYPRWVARSFLRAAEGYYRQGKFEVAQQTLRKLLDPREPDGKPDEKKIEKFNGLPELEQAKKRLTEMKGTV